MSTYISLALILWMIVPGAMSDIETIMGLLKSKTWPWFGTKYAKECPKSTANWPLCYNPRPDRSDSTLERVGIPADIKLTLELDITFSAPGENIDVCGKAAMYNPVPPFQLNTNGYYIKDLLKKGAEIYRKFPSVSWKYEENVAYELLVIDAGYIKVNGYLQNIRANKSNGLVGEIVWSYVPPSNPALHTNPNLIVLMKQGSKGPMSVTKLRVNNCMDKGLSVKIADSCRQYLTSHFLESTVQGVQVFYTDGSSVYEQYRACTKSTFCKDTCVSKIKSYVKAQESNIKFTTVNADALDMYVNVNFWSPGQLKYTACCSEKQIDPFNFRAVPGDNLHVGETYKANEHREAYMALEISGSVATASDTNTLYSVLIVDPDAPSGPFPGAPKQLYGHTWIANLKYQELTNTPGVMSMVKYRGPTPPDNSDHRYFVLLYSHTTAVNKLPDDFHSQACPGRCDWDLSKLPADFKLRALTWFIAGTDTFAAAKTIFLAGIEDSCAMLDPKYTATCAHQYADQTAMVYINHVVAIKITGAVAKSADPANNDQYVPPGKGGGGAPNTPSSSTPPASSSLSTSAKAFRSATILSMFFYMMAAGF